MSRNSTFRRVSERVFVRGRPRAVLGWIDARGHYDEETVDPRYKPALPAPEAPRRG
ncbi:MAG TPA: hypothetical protein VJ778_08850 [Burkholderiales bacterium]|nr:hypothetical protein [Burkholderiales bacterium]